MLLLYCTRKKKKGPHCQCPGGHVDKEDYDDITLSNVQGSELLIEACKRGAARELYEETSIDVRSALDR
jgi:8-oxo-dGTP pyrophosphatase MutT (NUDIX family)